MSVRCSLMVNCWQRAYLLALFYAMCSCVFVTFPFGVLSQVLYLIVLIPDICLLTYFDEPDVPVLDVISEAIVEDIVALATYSETTDAAETLSHVAVEEYFIKEYVPYNGVEAIWLRTLEEETADSTDIIESLHENPERWWWWWWWWWWNNCIWKCLLKLHSL